MPRKTSKGAIHYKPLKMARDRHWVLKDWQATPREGVADNPV
ncbi:hypothetical protein [Confluentibacter flavum]|nr:hypothetical protein [Confluentibacter flavum]